VSGRKWMVAVSATDPAAIEPLRAQLLGAPIVDGAERYVVDVPTPDEPARHPDDFVAVLSVTGGDPSGASIDGAALTAYEVDERLQWDYDRDWPDGMPSPGMKQMSFVRRLPTITHDAFADHWSNNHTPLARIHHPGIWRYCQNVVIDRAPGAPEVDGISELQFRTADDMHTRMYDSDEGKAIIAEDVKRFIERSAGWRQVAQEHILHS